MRRLLLAVAVVALVLGAAGCSSSDDGEGDPPSTTTTVSLEITDEEIVERIDEELRPALERAFGPDTVECLIGVLQEAGVGDVAADDLISTYEERCDVKATDVTAAIVSSDLIDRGASEDKAGCVRDAIAAMTVEEASALDEAGVDEVYAGCGIDPETLEEE